MEKRGRGRPKGTFKRNGAAKGNNKKPNIASAKGQGRGRPAKAKKDDSSDDDESEENDSDNETDENESDSDEWIHSSLKQFWFNSLSFQK